MWLLTGGTLIVDQAGGMREGRAESFDSAFRKTMTARYGENALGVMHVAHPLLAGLDEVPYRNMGVRTKAMRPRLESVTIAGRPAIIYSRDDLTCGLLGCPNPLVGGLTEEGAWQVLSRLVIRASGAELKEEVRSQKEEAGSQKEEVGSQKEEVRSRRAGRRRN